jgi:hypothetical protein
MTESEAIKRCNMLVNGFNVDNATETAFTDIERGYATFATMVEFAETCKMALEIIQELHAIGTVSEFRELKEKTTAKMPIYSDFDENGEVDENGEEVIIPYKATCPVCGYEFEFGTWNDEQNHHCSCGQRMLWD